MGDTYRVSIVRESGSGAEYETETVFEVAGGIGLVVKVAPGALVDALRAADEQGVPEAANTAERVMDAAAAAGAPIQPSKQRKRRTKMEIAADEAAVALGFRDAAHRAEAEQATANTYAAAGVEQPTSAQVEAAASREPVAAPDVPYNPFEVK